jgi:rubredoxin
LDGSFGIEVTMSEGWEPEFDDVAIHEYSGVAPKSLIKDPKNPFKDVPEGACPNCGAQDTLVDTSAFLTESCKCSACGWEDAHSGGVV